MIQESSNLILIVNDNPDQLDMLGTLLETAGYRVETASDGYEGLELARTLRPNLVLSDVNMPRMSGIELCRSMRADPVLSFTAIMLVSAECVDSESAVEGLQAGADDYLEAPYDPMRMVAKVTRLMERKKVEEALRESEGKYRQIVETANEGIWMIDRQGKTLFANVSLAEMLGTSPEEMIGRTAFEFVYQEDLAEANKRLSARTKGGVKEQTEFRIRRRDGTPIYALSNTSPLKNQAGEVTGILAMVSDITERKRAEDELRRQKEVLQKIFDHIPVMISFWDERGRLELVNREWERVRGWSLEEIRESTTDILAESYPDPQERQRARGSIHAATGEWEDFKTGTQDGRMIDAMWANLRLSDGTSISIGQDITERKRAEEKLRQSESQLVEAQRLAGVGSWTWDIQNNSLTWSEELYRMYGVDPQEFTPTLDAFMRFLHPEDMDFVVREIDTAMTNLESLDYHIRIVRRDGEVRILHSRGKVVADEHGLPLRMYGASQDVTERVLAEDQLKGSNEKLRALAARLQSVREEESLRIAREIHDELGGAMTGLKIDLAWVNKRIRDASDESVQQKIASMNEMIDDTIKAIRHISSELRPSILDDLGLAATIEWQAREFETRTEIKCRITSLAEDVPLDEARATALFRIFQEILTNVMRHAHATLVEVSMQEHNGELILRIKDNGVGIRETDVADTSSLGLLGMRERALVFGGQISIEGSEGEGTTVTVRLPLP